MNIKQVIELVEKWIADPKSVSRKELRAARAVAVHAADAWYAVRTAWCAAQSALNGDIYYAEHWVAKYHKNHND